ncbi:MULTISPECIES: hypothetical protein [unclassified Marichromatium]|uniref:hypothetical protein n=1 Tax=unclassified Marichromatium TaxID=2618417 RepID=UPI0016800F33|nr:MULTISPECIES: hypothetical protein [unclassified Marichromatium]
MTSSAFMRARIDQPRALQSMLGAEFAALEVIGKVLLDPTKTGAGRSRYFRVQMV